MATVKAPGKLDLYKVHAKEYAAKPAPSLVEIGPCQYLTIEGKGEPAGEIFVEKVGHLYAAAFGIKMPYKKATGVDYAIGKLEGLWWCEAAGIMRDGTARAHNPSDDLLSVVQHTPRSQWQWRMLIRTPDFITQQHLAEAIEMQLKKGKAAGIREVALQTIEEGLCLQALHIGPYASEMSTTIPAMYAYMAANGLAHRGLHHEIYLGDPNRVAPDKLKTILRQPVVRKG